MPKKKMPMSDKEMKKKMGHSMAEHLKEYGPIKKKGKKK